MAGAILMPKAWVIPCSKLEMEMSTVFESFIGSFRKRKTTK